MLCFRCNMFDSVLCIFIIIDMIFIIITNLWLERFQVYMYNSCDAAESADCWLDTVHSNLDAPAVLSTFSYLE